MKKLLAVVALVAALTGCFGTRETKDTFLAHAEAFRIVGIAIPGDDMAAARAQVPAGANIVTISSSPADWTSVWGFLGNLFGFHATVITGTKR
jgi:hypothetical protein